MALRLLKGIDVSAHQGDVDWVLVQRAGIRFVWVKATEGADFVDVAFSRARVNAIRKAGLKFGPYHYLRPRRDRNGAVEARHAVKTAKAAGWRPSKRFVWGRHDFPLCVDVERGGNEAELNAMSGAQLREYVSDFCDEVKRLTGRGCVVYLSPGFAPEFGGTAPRNGALCWVAAWDAPDGNPPVPTGWKRRLCRFHQTGDKGLVPGIHGPVDTNVFMRFGGGHKAPDPAAVPVRVQRLLRTVGWPIKVDGVLGPESRCALKDFQQGFARETLVVDGSPGPKTIAALEWSAEHDGRTSEHFRFEEFASKSTPECKGNGWIWVHRDLIRALEVYRRRVGHPVGVLSGCRDPKKNACVGGATRSQHLTGRAMDPSHPELRPNEVAALKVFTGIGFDRQSGLVRHMDVRPGNVNNPAIFPE